MAIGFKEEENAAKQWDVISIGVEPVHLSYWGIQEELMPLILQLLKQEGIAIKAGEKSLITFSELRQVVAYLHSKGLDTSDLTGAVRQAIEKAMPEASASRPVSAGEKPANGKTEEGPVNLV